MTTTKAAKSPPPKARTAYLVLGMHRSGTSAVTQLLGLAGGQLPQNLMPGDEHNAKGYFEPWKIAVFNDERLEAAGSAWDDVFAHPFRGLGPREERGWLNRAASLFEEEYPQAPWPVLKDPRVTVLLPFWRTVLGDLEVGARVVISLRHPLAVAASLARRDGFAVEKSLLLWACYMLAAEAGTRDLPRVFVDYDALLADWRAELGRMEAALGPFPAPLTPKAEKAIDRFLTPTMRHNPAEGDLRAYGWVGALAAPIQAWCEAAARGEAPDRAPLEAATAELARRGAEFGLFVSPVCSALAATRRRLADAERLIEIERGWAADRESDIRAVAAAREHEVLGAAEAARAQLEDRLRQAEAEIGALRRRWSELDGRLNQILAEG
jgi:hypothetical protein